MKKDEYMNRMKLALQNVSVDWRNQRHQHILEQIEQQVNQGFIPGPEFHAGVAFTLICFDKGLEGFTELNTLPVDVSQDVGLPDSQLVTPRTPTDETGLGRQVSRLASQKLKTLLAPASWMILREEELIGLIFPRTHQFYAHQIANHPTELMTALNSVAGSDYKVMVFVGEEMECIFTANTSNFPAGS